MDLNGDGRLDILTGSIGGDLAVYYRKPNGTFAAPEVVRYKDGRAINLGRSSSIAVSDWDGDGLTDLIVGTGDGSVYLIRNTGTPQKPVWTTADRLKSSEGRISADGGGASPYVADWDSDGLPDLILGSATGKVVWYRNIGTKSKPQLAAAATLIEAQPQAERGNRTFAENPRRSGAYCKPCVADWNGDGRLDLIVGDYAYSPPNRLHGWVWVYLRTPAAQAQNTR